MKTTLSLILTAALAGLLVTAAHAADMPLPTWKHLSSKTGDLPEPNGGKQQTACVVFDVDQDGAADIVIAERTQAPGIIWLRHTKTGWEKYIIDDTKQRPEAGGWPHDVDGDGDLDLIIGGDGGSDELWWYENPAPKFVPHIPWKQRTIKKGGGKAHHDHVVADVNGDGRLDIVTKPCTWDTPRVDIWLNQASRNPVQ